MASTKEAPALRGVEAVDGSLRMMGKSKEDTMTGQTGITFIADVGRLATAQQLPQPTGPELVGGSLLAIQSIQERRQSPFQQSHEVSAGLVARLVPGAVGRAPAMLRQSPVLENLLISDGCKGSLEHQKSR